MTVESLPRYERLPREYFAMQLAAGSLETLQTQVGILQPAGLECRIGVDRGQAAIRVMDPEQLISSVRGWYPWLYPGDWVTFRPDERGGWSINAYADNEFRERFREASS